MKNASVRYNSLSNDGSTEDWCSAVVPEEWCLRSHFTETDECSRQRVFLQSPIINTVLGSVYNSSSSVDPMEDLVLQLTHFSIESVMVEDTLVKSVPNALLYWLFPYTLKRSTQDHFLVLSRPMIQISGFDGCIHRICCEFRGTGSTFGSLSSPFFLDVSNAREENLSIQELHCKSTLIIDPPSPLDLYHYAFCTLLRRSWDHTSNPSASVSFS